MYYLLIRKFDEAVKTKLSVVECWGNGTPKEEFMHVDDLGKACLYVLESGTHVLKTHRWMITIIH